MCACARVASRAGRLARVLLGCSLRSEDQGSWWNKFTINPSSSLVCFRRLPSCSLLCSFRFLRISYFGGNRFEIMNFLSSNFASSHSPLFPLCSSLTIYLRVHCYLRASFILVLNRGKIREYSFHFVHEQSNEFCT